METIGLAFLEGLGIILSPCILPTAQNTPIIKQDLTQETYLGFQRSDPSLRPKEYLAKHTKLYSYPNQLIHHAWALQGLWQVTANYIQNREKNATLQIHVHARQMFVMGTDTHSAIPLMIRFRHTPSGSIVWQKLLLVQAYQLYALADFATIQDEYIDIQAQTTGLKVYTLTFG